MDVFTKRPFRPSNFFVPNSAETHGTVFSSIPHQRCRPALAFSVDSPYRTLAISIATDWGVDIVYG
jgi:hypothetical protein